MGCDCGCHKKLDAIGVRGCCFECEKEHDPLRNALSQNERLKEMLNEVRGKAFQDVFSDEPSNFAALVLKIVEDGYIDKEKCKHPEIMHNSRTDKHRCGMCYAELPGIRCGLCEVWESMKSHTAEEYKASADLWATRWSRLKGNFEKLELENSELKAALDLMLSLYDQGGDPINAETFAKIEQARALAAGKRKCLQELEDGSPCGGFIPCPRHFREQNFKDYLEKQTSETPRSMVSMAVGPHNCPICGECPMCIGRE